MDPIFQGMSMGQSWVLDAVLHSALEEADTPGGFVDPRIEGIYANAHRHKQLQRQQEQLQERQQKEQQLKHYKQELKHCKQQLKYYKQQQALQQQQEEQRQQQEQQQQEQQQQTQQELQEQQQQQEQYHQDEAATRVQAWPMPPFSRGFVPQRSKRLCKETKEFRLSSQARHELEAQEFRELIIIEDELIRRRASEVHALPLPEETFKPKPYRRGTKVSPFQRAEVTLNSTARAEARARWEVRNQARLEAMERCRREKTEALAAELDRVIAEFQRPPLEEGGMDFEIACASCGASSLALNASLLCRDCCRQSSWVSRTSIWTTIILLQSTVVFFGFVVIAAVLLGD